MHFGHLMAAVWCTAALVLVGCGPKRIAVIGTVTFEGIDVAEDMQPTINFTHTGGMGTGTQGAAGTIQDDGQFVVKAKGVEGVCGGQYKVTVAVWGDVGRNSWRYPGPPIPVDVTPSTVTISERTSLDVVVKPKSKN